MGALLLDARRARLRYLRGEILSSTGGRHTRFEKEAERIESELTLGRIDSLREEWRSIGRAAVEASSLVNPRRYVTMLAVERAAESMIFLENRVRSGR